MRCRCQGSLHPALPRDDELLETQVELSVPPQKGEGLRPCRPVPSLGLGQAALEQDSACRGGRQRHDGQFEQGLPRPSFCPDPCAKFGSLRLVVTVISDVSWQPAVTGVEWGAREREIPASELRFVSSFKVGQTARSDPCADESRPCLSTCKHCMCGQRLLSTPPRRVF